MYFSFNRYKSLKPVTTPSEIFVICPKEAASFLILFIICPAYSSVKIHDFDDRADWSIKEIGALKPFLCFSLLHESWNLEKENIPV